jgi:hypothetical protein
MPRPSSSVSTPWRRPTQQPSNPFENGFTDSGAEERRFCRNKTYWGSQGRRYGLGTTAVGRLFGF